MYRVFTDFNKFSVQAIDVGEGVIGVRAAVSENASAVVVAAVSTALSFVFEERQEAEGNSSTCPVNIKLLLSSTVRNRCEVPSLSLIGWKCINLSKRTA